MKQKPRVLAMRTRPDDDKVCIKRRGGHEYRRRERSCQDAAAQSFHSTGHIFLLGSFTRCFFLVDWCFREVGVCTGECETGGDHSLDSVGMVVGVGARGLCSRGFFF